jgi:hypothetical protein
MTGEDARGLELQLAMARIEGSMNTGFATITGQIQLLDRGREHNAHAIDEVETRVENLEQRRFPLPVIGGLVGVLSIALSGFTLVRGG